MTVARDGMSWAPRAQKPSPVVEKGQFQFASAFFEHGHIYGQTNGLSEAEIAFLEAQAFALRELVRAPLRPVPARRR